MQSIVGYRAERDRKEWLAGGMALSSFRWFKLPVLSRILSEKLGGMTH